MITKNASSGKHTAWRDLLMAPDQNQAIILAIYFFASCLVLPLADNSTIATVYMASCVFLYYGMNHSLRSMLLYALPAIPLVLLSSILPGVPNLMTLPCAYVALLVGGSSGAFLLTHYHSPRKHWFWILLPAAAYGCVFGLTGAPLRSLLVLLPAALALAAAACLLCCFPCKDAVLVIAITLVGTGILAGLIALAVRGQLHGNFLKALAENVRLHVISSSEEARALYAQAGLEITISEADLANTAISLTNLAPGIVLALCACSAFLLWRSLLNMLISFRSLPRLPVRMAALGMGRTPAVLFLAAFVVSLFASIDAPTTVSAICDNLCLVLEPGLVLIAFASLFSKNTQRSCLTSLIGIGLIAALFVDLFTALSFAAFYGAVILLTTRRTSAKQDTNDENDEKGDG